MLVRFLGVSFAWGWLCAVSVCGQTSYPMLMAIEPIATTIGTTSEHLVKARYSLAGAYEVIVSGEGVRGEVLPADGATEGGKPGSIETAKIRFHVDPQATPGIRDFRIATPRGVSTVGQVVIVSDPIVNEVDDKNSSSSPQKITFPTVLCGRLEKAEDVDEYAFRAEAGESLSFHMLCMRLQDRIHDLQQHADPMLTIRNAMGSTVVAANNEFRADPFIHHVFEQAGEYVLEVRDVRYQGNTYWGYCIEANHRPFVPAVYPLAHQAGKSSPVAWIHRGQSDRAASTLELPTGLAAGIHTWPLVIQEGYRTPVSILVSDHPTLLESSQANDSLDKAQSVSVPVTFNGQLESPNDIDYLSFSARKGEKYDIEVIAARCGSMVDAHLRVLDAEGKALQVSDDIRIGKRNYSDSVIEGWTAPSDGVYFLELRDLHSRGGAEFPYALTIQVSEPFFKLFADTDKTLVTPTTAGVVFVRAERHNGASGEIELMVDRLPPGVIAHSGKILAGKGEDGCIVFEAAEGTKPSLSDIHISGKMVMNDSEGKPKVITSDAIVYQETYQPGGGRGHWPVDHHVVAVCEPSDIRRITLNTHEVVLKPGDSQKIEVQLERAAGFDKNVTLDVTVNHLTNIFGNSLPEGVTIDAAASNTLLTGGASKGHLVLKAAKTAKATAPQQITVMANVSINFVMKATYASRPVFVSITPP